MFFTKTRWGFPIKNNKPEECVRACKEVLNKIRKPQQIYHDNEGSVSSIEFVTLSNGHKVEQLIVSTKAPSAKRAVQTINNMIHTRIEGLDLPVEKWVEMLTAILTTYNNTKHSTTGVTPHEAKREDNIFKAWLNIKNKTEFNRKCPPLSVGNFVRNYEPPKHTKCYKSVWSSKVYNITFMNENGYLIYDYYKNKVYQRNKILNTDGAEDK